MKRAWVQSTSVLLRAFFSLRGTRRIALAFGILLLIATNYAAGQSLQWAKRATWQAAFDRAAGIAVDGAGNSYVTGSSGGVALVVAKYDGNGALLWVRQATGGSETRGQAISVDAAGNTYVTGGFRFGMTFDDGTTLIEKFPGVGDIFVAKYDTNGNFIWARQFASDFIPGVTNVGAYGRGISVDKDGNIHVTGNFATSLGEGTSSVFVATYDASGVLLWARQARIEGTGAGTGMSVDGGGNSYVTGSFNGSITFGPGETSETVLIPTGFWNMFVAKYDGSGALQWARRADGEYVTAEGIAVDEAGNAHITGTFSRAIFGPGEVNERTLTAVFYDMFVAKYDTDGALQWAKHAPGPGLGGGSAIAVDGGGNIHVTGGFGGFVTFGPGEINETTLTTGALDDELFVVRYDGNGSVLWARQTSGTYRAEGRGIAADRAGTAYVTGTFGNVFGNAGDPTSVVFGPGEINETVLTTASGSGTEIFVAKYSNDVVQPNRPPVAHAGADQSVAVGTTVQLDGSGSTDADSDPLTFDWAFMSKPPASGAVLQNATTSNPTFVADAAGAYHVRLVVNDGQASSAPDPIIITTINRAPSANAGSDQSATAGSTILFNGSGSSDPDGDALTFSWSFVSRPPLSAAVLINPTGVTPSFIADAAGTYEVQLIVNDGNLDSVDAVRVTITPPNPGLFTCGSLTSGTISAAGEVDEFSFSGQAGQIISLALASTGGFTSLPASRSAELTLVSPTGVLLGTLVSNSQSTFELPANGVYVVRVAARNRRTRGSYNVNLECLIPAFSPPAIPLSCGDHRSGTISAPGQVDLYTFEGQPGRVVSLAVASTGGFSASPGHSQGLQAAVLAPSGTVVQTFSSNSQTNLALSESGTYVVRINATRLSVTGSYNVNLECLIPAFSPPAIPLSCGDHRSGTISAPGQVDLYTFEGQPGRVVSLAVASTGGFSASPGHSQGLQAAVFAPSGALVLTFSSNSQANLALSESGTYIVRVNATRLSVTGSYNLSLSCMIPAPSPPAIPLACDDPAAGTIDAPARLDLYTFAGQAGSVISLSLISTRGFSTSPGNSRSAQLTLFAPDGTLMGTLYSNSQGRFTLLGTGSYVVRVSARNLSTTGAYTVTLGCS
jgi:PKD domain/Beta-propeller repeat